MFLNSQLVRTLAGIYALLKAGGGKFEQIM